jgi:hypothetical protein
MSGEHVRVGLDQHPVRQREQVRLMLTQPGARVPAGRQRTDLDFRMTEEQPKQLAPRVPAGSSDRYP